MEKLIEPGRGAASPSRTWYSNLVYLWIFIPAIIYFKIVNEYAVNIPWRDDYDAVLNFLCDFKNASFWQKLSLLVSQHNEHRMLPARLSYVLYNALFGQVNFRHLILLGDIQLLFIFFVSIHFIRRCAPKHWDILAFIWGLCIFDVNTWENGDVTMTSLSNYGVVAMFFISLFFYSLEKRKYLIPAVFFQVLCMFSSGGGIIGSLFIAVFAFFSEGKWKARLGIATLIVFSLLYFVNYKNPHPPTVPMTIFGEISFFLSMLGTHFNFVHGLVFGLILMALLLFAFPFTQKGWMEPRVLPFVCIIGYMGATIAATALFRSNLAGSIYWSSKYLIYPNLLTATIFLLLFLRLKDSKILWPVTIVCILGMLLAYRQNYIYGKDNFARENLVLRTQKYDYPDSIRAKSISENACKAGIYCIEEHRPTR
jgi:hypothetical protein